MKIALLFPGQGSQSVGMGQDLYNHYTESKNLFDTASDLLGWDLKQLCFEDEKGLINETRYTQPALFTTNLAAYETLRTKGIKAEAVLGFSLGEYCAIVASGVLDFKEGLKLVENRAIYMDECAKKNPGGMVAVLGASLDTIRKACETTSKAIGCVEIANDNCEGQVTLSGTKDALEYVSACLKTQGVKRVIPLKVSGAFHSSMMAEAAIKIDEYVQKIMFNAPTIPIVSNVSAEFINQEAIQENIKRHTLEGVRFRESIEYLVENGFDTFIEVGNKKTLCNLVVKIAPNVKVFHVEDVASLENVAEIVGGRIC